MRQFSLRGLFFIVLIVAMALPVARHLIFGQRYIEMINLRVRGMLSTKITHDEYTVLEGSYSEAKDVNHGNSYGNYTVTSTAIDSCGVYDLVSSKVSAVAKSQGWKVTSVNKQDSKIRYSVSKGSSVNHVDWKIVPLPEITDRRGRVMNRTSIGFTVIGVSAK